jgi:hypothetical protein
MPVGMMAAIAAVLVDSVVTLYVGRKLANTAKTQIAKGVQDVIDNAPSLIAEAFMPKSEVKKDD